VIIYLGKSVVNHWISNGERERERERERQESINQKYRNKILCAIGYRSMGIKLLVTNGEGFFDLTKKKSYN
jgi:hypothetical protein